MPSDSSGCGGGRHGRYTSPENRVVKNLRVRFYRETTLASNINESKIFNVLTYNVRTLVSDEGLIDLENALKGLKWDIVVLAKARRLKEDNAKRDDNVFFHFGETNRHHGVGFRVAKK